MKTLLLILITWMALPAFSQTRKEKEAAKQENVRKALEADRYTIDINYMIPSKGSGRPLTTDYSVTVRNDSLISYLPYAGRAYSIPYGGGKALNFSAPIENYEKKTKKKGETEITVSLRNDEDSYIYRLTVYKNGNASLYVQPTQRQSISFSGEMDLKEN